MGTRAIILNPVNEFQDYDDINDVLHDDTECRCIEMFQDSYPSNVLDKLYEILKQYDIKFIMSNGNISSLKSLYEPNELGFHDAEHPQSDVTIVINRDVKYSTENEMKLIKMKERKDRYRHYDYVYLVNDSKIYFDTNLNNTLNLKHMSEYTEDWEGEE